MLRNMYSRPHTIRVQRKDMCRKSCSTLTAGRTYSYLYVLNITTIFQNLLINTTLKYEHNSLSHAQHHVLFAHILRQPTNFNILLSSIICPNSSWACPTKPFDELQMMRRSCFRLGIIFLRSPGLVWMTQILS